MTLVSDVTMETYEREIATAAVPVLMDFYAQWCKPCKALAPALEDVAREYGSSARVIKVDIDAQPELANRFGVRSVPTLVLVHAGQERQRVIGLVSRSHLAGMIERYVEPERE